MRLIRVLLVFVVVVCCCSLLVACVHGGGTGTKSGGKKKSGTTKATTATVPTPEEELARRTRGVPPHLMSKYSEKDEEFECGTDSGIRIPAWAVNDDYCDCPDGSDEPGTTACSNGQFFCANTGHEAQYISSSKVNDGYCDCCDGSDEYASPISCKNTCADLGSVRQEQQSKERKERERGWRARQIYVKEGTALRKEKQENVDKLRAEQDGKLQQAKEAADLIAVLEKEFEELKETASDTDQLQRMDELEIELEALKEKESRYRDEADAWRQTIQAESAILAKPLGPENEYYAVYDKCFSLDTREYSYEVCPFNKVTQKSLNGGSSTRLGTFGRWDNTDFLRMHFEHGEGCWQGPQRSTAVDFICGSENKVMSVDEPSRCVYHIVMATPAACTKPDWLDE